MLSIFNEDNYKLLPREKYLICFSGGRTSAYLLSAIAKVNDGIPDNAIVVFSNTGREHEKTYSFVREVGERLGIKIYCVEYTNKNEKGYKVVDHADLDTTGKPFFEIVDKKNILPNRVTRFCTQELKIKPSRSLSENILGSKKSDIVNIVGFRYDEKRRIKNRTKIPGSFNYIHEKYNDLTRYPLVDDGITRNLVNDYWMLNSDYDLGLYFNGKQSPMGNCDGCFLKSEKSKFILARYNPDKAKFWQELEEHYHKMKKQDEPEVFNTINHGISWSEIIEKAKNFDEKFFEDNYDFFCESEYGHCEF